MTVVRAHDQVAAARRSVHTDDLETCLLARWIDRGNLGPDLHRRKPACRPGPREFETALRAKAIELVSCLNRPVLVELVFQQAARLRKCRLEFLQVRVRESRSDGE